MKMKTISILLALILIVSSYEFGYNEGRQTRTDELIESDTVLNACLYELKLCKFIYKQGDCSGHK